MEPESILEMAIGEAVKANKRTVNQNDKLWAMLGTVSEEVEWYGQYLSKNDWKWIFTAALREQRMVPGINGGIVYLGAPTSKMSKKDVSEMIEMIYAFGVEHDIDWDY